MAKQLGIHQLRGKVGDRSYYAQKGITSGLTRRISPTISEDVKTKESYATFRVAGKEFGELSMIASTFIHAIAERYAVIVSRDAQSKLIKALHDVLPNHSTWSFGRPYRHLDNFNGLKFLESIIESINKTKNAIQITATLDFYSRFHYQHYQQPNTGYIEFSANLHVDVYFQTWLNIKKYQRVKLQIITCCTYSSSIIDGDVRQDSINYIVKYSTPRYYTQFSSATSISSNTSIDQHLQSGEILGARNAFTYVLYVFIPQKKIGNSYIDYVTDACFFCFAGGVVDIFEN